MTERKIVLPDSAYLQAGSDGRLQAPSAERNFAPILAHLTPLIPATGRVLELASGTGQQIAKLAGLFADTQWQPSDLDPARIDSIRAWRDHCGHENLLPPVCLDAAQTWPAELSQFGLIFVVNLLHLVGEGPGSAIIAHMAAALAPGGSLFIYGPFREADGYRSAGDRQFDASLRAQDPAIGYKSRAWLRAQLESHGLGLRHEHEMPANNLAFVATRP